MRSIRGMLSLGISAAAFVGLSAVANAGSFPLFGISSSDPGSVYQINSATGDASVVTPVPLSGGDTEDTFNGVGLAYLNGTVYASDVTASSGPYAGQTTFGTLNVLSGVYTPLSDQNGSSFVAALAANQSANVLYAIDNSGSAATLEKISIDGSGAHISTIGSADSLGQSFNAIAYDNATGALYGLGSDDSLYTIDPVTGLVLTDVGPTGLSGLIDGMTFGVDGQLYVNDSTFGGSLYTLDTGTGAATLDGPNNIDDGLGIGGITVVPEPATVALAGLALPALGWVVLKRRNTAVRIAPVLTTA